MTLNLKKINKKIRKNEAFFASELCEKKLKADLK